MNFLHLDLNFHSNTNPSAVPLSANERWSFAVKFRTNKSKSIQHLELKNVVFALDKSKSYLYDYVEYGLKKQMEHCGRKWSEKVVINLFVNNINIK